ncbi:hypothetical protein CDD83_4721 [Cordyceps sp. RAO-2017]|nr:hypothetical protein CDD83_4721 [Cordyceps sp. RAO-2017]
MLDVKNDLLLSYLQNLVFLILVKLRNARAASTGADAKGDGIDESVRAKLIELRLFLEKGARPLEDKLQFSIERFLRTAEDAQREERSKPPRRGARGKRASRGDDSGASSDAAAGQDDDSDSGSDSAEVCNPFGDEDDGPSGRPAAPNLNALVDIVPPETSRLGDAPPGIYVPPRRQRALMETTRPREKAERRPNRSHTMEEFVMAELSTAPVAEPSIGTTIVQGGRKTKTAQERKEEAERREYEETNLVRLPKPSKKERAKKNKEAGRGGRMQFGGEEWAGLGEGVARIDQLTRRKGPAGAGVKALLEKSRKRGLDGADGPRGSGHGPQIGERFRKRAKLLEVGRRDRGKGRK